GIVYAEDEHKIYALKGGSKHNEFYFYDIQADTWSHFPGDTLPRGIKNRQVKDGGALTYCNGKIYAIKGGGRNEFWCYCDTLGTKQWIMLDSIPKFGGFPKSGASLTAGAGIIYLLKGNKTNECWAYFPRSQEHSHAENEPEIVANTYSEAVKFNYRLAIDITPNPAKDNIDIIYCVNEPMGITLKLHNITGRVLSIIKHSPSTMPGRYREKLSVANLPAGIYFISLEGSHKQLIAKFIVQ
ncbi:MAG: T9SS type A sorting domain-containing protein, partial [candidate division WOR-3 bacterium]|nr:T9SS type A sorting domain-containing protein [candidate division WOR-3 bacterium]